MDVDVVGRTPRSQSQLARLGINDQFSITVVLYVLRWNSL